MTIYTSMIIYNKFILNVVYMERKDNYYFAYGSNLNHVQMLTRCPNSILIGKTMLENYKLAFKGSKEGLAYLTIEPSPNSNVPIGIYKISKKKKKRLDIYEGYPKLYKKEIINIPLNDKETISGIIYIMNPLYSYNIPSYSYYLICEEGYRNFDFDSSYLEEALKDINKKKKSLKT